MKVEETNLRSSQLYNVFWSVSLVSYSLSVSSALYDLFIAAVSIEISDCNGEYFEANTSAEKATKQPARE